MSALSKTRVLGQRTFRKLILITGVTVEGPFVFESDGAIGAYPRFSDKKGQVVFLHAVALALEEN